MLPCPPTSTAYGCTPARADAFTLVELLTSLMVASIIMVALMQSLSSATDSWVLQSKSFSAQREARVGLRILADDLNALVALPNRPAGQQQPSRFIFHPSPDPLGSSRVAFLRAIKPTRRSQEIERGDLRLVLYGLTLITEGGTSAPTAQYTTQRLVRRTLSAEETYNRIRGHLDSNVPLVNDGDWQALALAAPENEALTYDVIRFDVRVFDDVNNPTPTTSVWPTQQVPAWIDIVLRVTNRQTAQFLNTAEDWRGEGAVSQLLTNGTPLNYEDDREVRTYVMRQRLPSDNL